MTILSIKPLDILMLRGNRLFGGGVHGMGQMPPWPSVLTGAVASRVLADRGLLPQATTDFSRVPELLRQELGSDFGLHSLALEKGGEVWCPIPADLLVFNSGPDAHACSPLRPKPLHREVRHSSPLPLCPVLEKGSREKPLDSMLLRAEALARHLSGACPQGTDFLPASSFWANDPRLGIALDGKAGTAEEGAIYTTDGIALGADVTMLAGFAGRDLPRDGLIRLGGDGRAATVKAADAAIQSRLADLGRPGGGWGRFRMVLATPGLFPEGWRPPGVDESGRFLLDGLEAQLVAASVPRPGVISGWDLAAHAPKAAHRVVPTGGCYWFEVKQGDTQALERLWREGLWPLIDPQSAIGIRRHEGWNRVWFGTWDS